MKNMIKMMGMAGVMAFTLQINAQTVINPSFEEDTYTVWPGYSRDNGGVITGWFVAGGAGINPSREVDGSPFANNGAIPDGNQVAFIQDDSEFIQTVSGFTVGSDYIVKYFENARSGNRPALTVSLGGEVIVPEHIVTAVGGTNPYRAVTSRTYTATWTDLDLTFTKSNPLGGDNTVLIDNISIEEIPAGTAPVFTQQPVGGTVVEGGNITLRADGYGSTPYTFQWRRNGDVVEGATENVLEIQGITAGQAGTYTLEISNAAGETLSTEAVVQVLDRVPGIYNTGQHTDGSVLADGEIDQNYRLVVNPDGESEDAIVQDSQVFPIVSGPWVANDEDSKWIGPRFDTTAAAGGDYVYRTTFDLTGFDHETAEISATWATDNAGVNIFLNGQPTGITSPDFTALRPFSLTSGFIAGVNTLEFRINNSAVGYTGLRVDDLQVGGDAVPAGTAATIVRAPTAQTGRLTGSATFSVGARGSMPVSYQWFFGDTELTGETSHTLTLENLTAENAGAYSVRVTNNDGSATSVPVALTVKPQTDLTTDKYAGIWIEGIVGRQYRIEYSESVDSEEWNTLTTITLAQSPEFYLDRDTPSSEQRFYRAVLLP